MAVVLSLLPCALQVLAFPPWAAEDEDVRAIKVELKSGDVTLKGGWDAEVDRDPRRRHNNQAEPPKISFNDSRREMEVSGIM